MLKPELPRACCGSPARGKFVEAEPSGPEVARTILRLIKNLFALETRRKDMMPDERLRRRQAEAVRLLGSLQALLLEQ